MTEGNQEAQLPHLVDIETLANLLATTVRHLRGLVAEQQMPCLHLGRLLRFDPVEIMAWLKDRRKLPKRERTRE